MPDDFFSFDEALDELRLKEEELKRLVSEGEIRAFRKGDTMKLRKSDVESLRAELDRAAGGGEVVDLGETAAEELVFEDDADLDDAGMATQEIADVDTLVEDVGELELEEDDDAPVALAAVAPRRARAAVEEEESEGMGLRFAMIASALVMFLAVPVCVAISTGQADNLAQKIAGVFGNKFEAARTPVSAPAE